VKFVDQVKVQLRAGKGGNGCASFRREKFIPRGGPNGGNGGDGGDIWFRGDPGKATLLDFQFRQHFRAPDGEAGKGKDMHGRNGAPLTIAVPLGTLVRDADSGELLCEILTTEPVRCLRGGRGGRGNVAFKSSTHRVPREFEEGHPGEERWVTLELKLMADVGLVGFPNVGKSTLIGRVSKAHPKVADYPFTTLVPNLGVVQTEDFQSFVMADIPGIIRGAHAGAGLGHRFLRHVERTAVLLLLVELAGLAGRDAYGEYEVLLEEMALFSPLLPAKPRLVALTKADAADDPAAVAALRQRLEAAGERVLVISAVSGAGMAELVRELGARVRAVREAATRDVPAAPSTPGS